MKDRQDSRVGSTLVVLMILASLVMVSEPASAGDKYTTVTQFADGSNSTTLSFGSCGALDNSTGVKLPYNANVTAASLVVYTGTNSSNGSDWVSADVGEDGSVEANVSLGANASATMNLGGSGFNNYTAAKNLSSGNISVPILFTSCPPGASWNLTFYNLRVTYYQSIPANTSAPVFSGTIGNLSLKVNTSNAYAVYLPSYFSEPDNDTLNYTILKANASDTGWPNVSVQASNPYLALNSTNNWTGNLTFQIRATDPANLSATSNNITLEVYLNRPPAFGSGNFSSIPDQRTTVNLTRTAYISMWYYFTDPDTNDSLMYSIEKANASDPGWANVTVSATASWFVFNSTNGWLGNLSFRVVATDTSGATARSNNITLEVHPNEAPEFYGPAPDLTMDRDSWSYINTSYFREPDGETMTFYAVKGDPNATGWQYVSVTGFNGSNETTGSYLSVYSSGNWSGTLALRVRARDPGGRTNDSNGFNITVNSRPIFNGPNATGIPDQTIVRGTTSYALVNLSAHFYDPEGDSISYDAYRWWSGNNTTTPIFVTVNGSYLDIGSSHPTWTGSDIFAVQACDSYGRCEWSNWFTVNAVVAPNRAPVFNATLPDINVEQGKSNFSAYDVGAHFSDPDGDALTLGISKADPNATGWLYLTIAWNGSWLDVRSTSLSFEGALLVAFWSRDGSNAYAWSNNVTIHVLKRDLAPTFTGLISNLTMTAGTDVSEALDANDYFSDPNGLPLTYAVVNQSASEGWNFTTVWMNGSALYLSNNDTAGWTGTLCFAIQATDVNGSRGKSNEICLTVSAPANSPPAPSQPIPLLTAPAGESTVLIDLSQYFTDDRYVDQLEYSVITGNESEWASVEVTVDGSLLNITFVAPTPPANLTFRVVVTDLRGATYVSEPVVLRIEPRPSNVPPSVAGPSQVTLELGTAVEIQLQAYDDNGDSLSWSALSSASGLSAVIDPASGRLLLSASSLDERAGFAVVVTVSDGWGGTASIAIPVRVWDPVHVPEVTLSLAANRSGALWINGSVVIWTQPDTNLPVIVRLSLAGGVPLTAPVIDGAFSFLYPANLQPGEYIVSASVTDGYGRTGAATKAVTVPEPLPLVPPLLGISVNGVVPSELDPGVAHTFTLDTAGALPEGVTVTWRLDGALAGTGSSLTIARLPPGPHTIEASATNGEDVRSASVVFSVRPAAEQPPIPAGPVGDRAVVLVAIFGAIAAFGLFAGASEVGRYFVVWAAVGSIFARLKRESLLDHFVRGRLYQAISEQPGIHLAELRRRTNVAHGTAIHHLHVLEKGGYVTVVVEGTHTRFYPTDRPLEEESYGLTDGDRAVLSVVANAPGLSEAELSQKLERSPSTVSRSVTRLAALGYVTTIQKGRKVEVYPRPGVQLAAGKVPDWPSGER